MFDSVHYLRSRHIPGGRLWPFLDCWGLVCEYYRRELGIQLAPHGDLDEMTMQEGCLRELGTFTEVSPADIADHDVVGFFRKGLLFHVGIYRDGMLLQSSKSRNCTFTPFTPAFGARVFRYTGKETLRCLFEF